MKLLKNNPSLSRDALESIIDEPFANLIVPRQLQYTASKLFGFFVSNLKVKEGEKEICGIEVVKKGYARLDITVEKFMSSDEWFCITRKGIYYSKGDNSV